MQCSDVQQQSVWTYKCAWAQKNSCAQKRQMSFPPTNRYEPLRVYTIPAGLSFNFSTLVATNQIRWPPGMTCWLSSI